MPEFSEHTLAILKLLRDRHNVLISGPPGTGKSRLLNEVARAFEGTAPSGPVHVPGAVVAIPKTPPLEGQLKAFLPSPDKTSRKVFRTVFHQNSKYRDFLTGLVPVVGSTATGGGTTFRIVAGTLYRASEHARAKDGASLLIIDEINRGPAVQVFGGSIVAIESDKRLAPDGSRRLETQFFEITAPNTGDLVEYALPHSLYILAAMNQADTSVEPLDVAFLRRWTPFRLDPSIAVLRRYFQLPSVQPASALADVPTSPKGVYSVQPAGALADAPISPKDAYSVQPAGALADAPTSPKDVYEAAVRAWSAVNRRIRLGRGPEFQIGHGVLMTRGTAATSVEDALQDAAESWRLIRAHIDEIFFGDVRGIAAVLNVGSVDSHPYKLEDSTFADEPRLELVGPEVVTAQGVFALLRAVAG